ncbi:MAG TPA: hypothetical protein VFT37_11005 [Telluria sp.]|nr:hypothetical protein [Telluria sp.]
MKNLKRLGIAAVPLALCGCLEVNQHPAWLNGKYAGKIDQLPWQTHFHHDRLAWSAAINNRSLYQNEYIRARPPGQPGAKRLSDIGATPAQNTGPGAPDGAGAKPGARAAQPPGAAAPNAPAGTGVNAPAAARAPAAAGANARPGSGAKPPAS